MNRYLFVDVKALTDQANTLNGVKIAPEHVLRLNQIEKETGAGVFLYDIPSKQNHAEERAFYDRLLSMLGFGYALSGFFTNQKMLVQFIKAAKGRIAVVTPDASLRDSPSTVYTNYQYGLQDADVTRVKGLLKP